MAPIATYVFLDLETTGLPCEEANKTKITELSLVAVKRDHVLDTRPGAAPRVQHKLTICFNPGRLIQPTCTDVTGLCNDLLEHEPYFNNTTFDMINSFVNMLTKPVCLIAQNGLNFDFPILKNHLEKLQVSFSEDLFVADCYHAFFDIETARKARVPSPDSSLSSTEVPKDSTTVSRDETDLNLMTNTLSMKQQNEATPKQNRVTITPNTPLKDQRNLSRVRRRFPWSEGSKPTVSYKLKDIYERLLNRPAVDAHRAENDCLLALECSIALAADFVKWVDENHMPFADVKPMTIGVRLGLLVMTGALWGCTNPFIRRGTRGLRDVKAKSWAGQAHAELVFLLGNWQYVVPWLVNQAGSLAYLLAVRRAPLSLAVPAANGLAFAFTALTGAAVGTEEPLDAGSILGISCIVAGTALCCWDNT